MSLRDSIDAAFEKAGYGAAEHEVDEPKAEQPEAERPEAEQPEAEQPEAEKAEGAGEGEKAEGEAEQPEAEKAEGEAEKEPVPTDAPTRFDPVARADWAKAPASVRREVARMERELTQGIEQHRQRVAEIEPFDKMAKEAGRKLPDVIASYVEMERMLRTDPVRGFTTLAQQIGVAPKDLAAMLADPANMQRPQQQAPQQPHPDYSGVKKEVGDIRRELEVRDKVAEIERWAKVPGHERFHEPGIAQDMARFLETGITADLDAAFDMACRLRPAAEKPKPKAPEPDAKPKPTPRGRASSKAGGPERKPSESVRDAVVSALRDTGVY